MKNVNDFRFFIPLSELQKGKNEQGNEVYKFRGLASDDSKDADDEYLDPDGFDLSSFKTINYNHFKEPRYLIGEATKAKIVKGKGLMIEGDIWPTGVGQQVVDLMKTMDRYSSSKSKLGISVEGRCLERDPNNPKRVTRAKLTGAALCPLPKNSNTWAELIQKGFVNNELEFDIQKSANGGEQFIIDVTNPETGMRYTIDKSFNIKVEKAISTTSSAKGIIKEDVEGAAKSLLQKDKEKAKAICVIAKAYEQGKIDKETVSKIKI